MKPFLLALAGAFWCCLVIADPTPTPVRAEIESLLAKLQALGCQFNRNGSWYSGSEAKEHLLRKLEYFEGKSAIQSTEQFIELAASRSSSSGQPYEVKCGSQLPVASQGWLTRQLIVIRGPVFKGSP